MLTDVGKAKEFFFCFADPRVRIVQFDGVTLEVTHPGSLQMLTYTRVGEAKNKTITAYFFLLSPPGYLIYLGVTIERNMRFT